VSATLQVNDHFRTRFHQRVRFDAEHVIPRGPAAVGF
jgi:hypothetical protein